MIYVKCAVIGAGTLEDPFRPAVVDVLPGTSWGAYVAPDNSAAVVWLPDNAGVSAWPPGTAVITEDDGTRFIQTYEGPEPSPRLEKPLLVLQRDFLRARERAL